MSASQVKFGVIGIEHFHAFEIVEGLVAAGAVGVAHASSDGPLLDMYAGWRSDSRLLTPEDVLADPSIDLIVLAGIPSERAAVAIAALEAGKHVVSDKPGVTTSGQLDAVLAAAAAAERRWWVLFSERFTNRAVAEGIERARAGAVGEIVHVLGLGPHTLAGDMRPDWFWDAGQTGGILTDIGSHQVDQFCAVVDPDNDTDIVVASSSVGNVASPDHPGMQDIGRVSLAAGNVVGEHRVDYLTAAGLDSWGDCRLMITGTKGTLEVRSNVDLAGVEGTEHLLQVNADGTHRIDCSTREVDWASRLLADIDEGTDTFVTAAHVERVCRLVLTAQTNATPWGTTS